MSQVITFSDYRPIARYDAVPWSEVRVQEGESSDGPWTTIDTIAISPVDDDPSDPATRSFTTAEADDALGLWYRLVFYDAIGDSAEPTQPVQNTESVAPDAFATPDDLATRLGLTLTEDERDRATDLLVIATGLIQDEVKQTLFLVEDDVLTIPGTSDDMIKLPQRPVVSVASVVLDGVTLTESTDWFLDVDAINRIPRTVAQVPSGLIDEVATSGRYRGFGSPRQTLVITYTHGYAADALPGAVKAICLEAVVRAWVNPGAAASTRVGDTHDTYTDGGLMLTDTERRTLRRLFGRKATSITVGR